MFLGDDMTGRALEIVAVATAERGLLVVHVDDLRAKFRPFYEAAKREEGA